MTDTIERLAQIIAFAGRDRNDVSKDASEFWAHIGLCNRQRHQAQAEAVIAALPSLVKLLEWEEGERGRWTADSILGVWTVFLAGFILPARPHPK